MAPMAQEFRKKTTIEAIQWIPLPGQEEKVAAHRSGWWRHTNYEQIERWSEKEATFIGQHIVVKTPEGWMTANLSDWIARGAVGEYYPIAGEIFAKTYELV